MDQKKQESQENVQPNRMDIAGPFAGLKLAGQPARLEKEDIYGSKGFAVEVNQVFDTLHKKMPEGGAKIVIFLAALGAKLKIGREDIAAVGAVRLLSAGPFHRENLAQEIKVFKIIFGPGQSVGYNFDLHSQPKTATFPARK